MKKRLLVLLILALYLVPVRCESALRQFLMALPGYKYSFPRDHASHNDYKTEWWYYTGHLNAVDGTKYGYELTFCRSAMNIPNGVPSSSPWSVDNVYLAHFAVSDLKNKRFFHSQRLTRSGIGFAGAESERYHVWNEDWSARLDGDTQLLHAHSPNYDINLALVPDKPLVIHGENGVSQKASCYGCASHYYSFTRLRTTGTIMAFGKRLEVDGISWMDHEFGSNQLTAEQVGWDWFSIQLDDKTELMLYQMRRREEPIDPNSSGTFVGADGRSVHLHHSDYSIRALGSWHSPETGATYPMGWHVEVPQLQIKLDIQPSMRDQELTKQQSADVTYREGASIANGTRNGQPVSGQAYVEMTGYAEKFGKQI